MKTGVAVYGGFAGTETLLSERDWFANPTVLSGDIDLNDNNEVNGIVTNVSDIVGNNAYHILVGSGVDATAVFDGFIINAGKADGTTLYHNYGGGVYLSLGSPTLNNLVISANTASNAGGGIYNDRSTATLSNLAIRGNKVSAQPSPGGGMFNHIGSPTLSNVLFSGNYAYDSGGFFTDDGTPNLINVTFSGNRSDRYGALHVGGGTPIVTNAIFWGNSGSISGSVATVTYSIVQGGYSGTGNLDVDPLFVEVRPFGEAPTTAGDYRLKHTSPAIEVGNNSPVTAATDLDFNARLADGDGDGLAVVDMGAYEWQGYTLTINIAGGGTVSQDPERSRFGYLEQVSLNATADTGWTFTGWSGEVTSTENPLILTMKDHTKITANFIQIEYALNITVSPDPAAGSVSLNPPQATYHYGDSVALTHQAAPGWTFDHWSGDASGTDATVDITITGSANITANFTQDHYTLTVYVSPAGAGSVTIISLQDFYHYGDEVQLTPVPNNDWTFSAWEGDVVSTDNPLTITIQGDTSITAKFIQVVFRLFLPLIVR